MKKDPDYHVYMNKMRQLTKVRNGIIKRYFDKHKYKRSSRNEIIEAAEETEVAI